MKKEEPGIGWFHGRWKKIFSRLDKEEIAASVRRLIRKHPDEDERKLVKRLIERSSRLSGAAGVAGSIPALFPGPGLAISVLSMVPEEMYLIHRQCVMLLQIAAVYGFDPKEEERLYEIIALAGGSSKTVDALMVAKNDLQRVAVRATAGLGHAPWFKRAFGLKGLGRGSIRVIPVLGFLMGGAINFFSFRALGRKAAFFYYRSRGRNADKKLLVDHAGRAEKPESAERIPHLPLSSEAKPDTF